METREIVKVDWLTLVFPVSDDVEYMTLDRARQLLVFIGFPSEWELYKLDHGMYRYDNAYHMVDKSTFLAFDDKSVMIQMSGAGVDNLSAVLREKELTILDTIRVATEDLNAHVTRIDVATDFINEGLEYSPYWLHEQTLDGALVSRANRARISLSYPTRGIKRGMENFISDLQVGFTFYLGSNPFQFRAYDKRAERAQKVGLADPEIESWYRWEFQINGVQANNFVRELADRDYNLSATYIDLLSSKYRFVDLESGNHSVTHRNRYPTATWWENIIEHARDTIKLTTPKDEPNMQKTEAWLQKQVYGTLSEYIKFRAHQYNKGGVSYQEAYEIAEHEVLDSITNHDEKLQRKIKQIFTDEE